MADRPVIEMTDVHLSLGSGPARVHILQGVSLQVSRGEALGLVGSSGSGKSTLLMTMAGLEQPDSGSVVVDDHRIDRMSEDALARFRGARIGVIFQSFHLIPTMTALENVAVPLELAGAADPFGRAAKELCAVGLENRQSHYPSQLSGGEQQRVAIARALAPDPAILRRRRAYGQPRRSDRTHDHRPALPPEEGARLDARSRHPRSGACANV